MADDYDETAIVPVDHDPFHEHVPVDHDPFDLTGGLMPKLNVIEQGLRDAVQTNMMVMQEIQKFGAIVQHLSEVQQQLAGAIEAMHRTAKAPKKIVRDENGWPKAIVPDQEALESPRLSGSKATVQ